MEDQHTTPKLRPLFWIVGCILLSIGGVAAFIVLIIPDFNVYWLILSPIIFVMYQAPAVLLYYIYKKRKKKRDSQDSR
ncbi:MAG: hypothetical protein PVF22_06380 [Candidatus Aminicenantes bacterium]|jgi:hypothetical protein